MSLWSKLFGGPEIGSLEWRNDRMQEIMQTDNVRALLDIAGKASSSPEVVTAAFSKAEKLATTEKDWIHIFAGAATPEVEVRAAEKVFQLSTDSETRARMLSVMIKVQPAELVVRILAKKATSIDDITVFLDKAGGVSLGSVPLALLGSFVTNNEDIGKLLEYDPIDGKLREELYKLYFSRLHTFDDWIGAMEHVYDGDELHRKAIEEKLKGFAKTADEWKRIYDETEDGDLANHANRMRFEMAANLDDLVGIYWDTDSGSDIEQKVIERIESFSAPHSVWVRLYKGEVTDTEPNDFLLELAAKRMLELCSDVQKIIAGVDAADSREDSELIEKFVAKLSAVEVSDLELDTLLNEHKSLEYAAIVELARRTKTLGELLKQYNKYLTDYNVSADDDDETKTKLIELIVEQATMEELAIIKECLQKTDETELHGAAENALAEREQSARAAGLMKN